MPIDTAQLLALAKWDRARAEAAFSAEGFMSHDNKAAIYANGAHWQFCRLQLLIAALVDDREALREALQSIGSNFPDAPHLEGSDVNLACAKALAASDERMKQLEGDNE